MKLEAIVFDDKIYNLDYMSSRQIKNLSKKIEEKQQENYNEGTRIISRKKKD